MRLLLIVTVLMLCVRPAVGQNTQSNNPQLQDITAELDKMHDAMSAQQQQIEAEHEKMAQQQQEIERLRSQLVALQNATTSPREQSSPQVVNAALHPIAAIPVGATLQESVPIKESPYLFALVIQSSLPGDL